MNPITITTTPKYLVAGRRAAVLFHPEVVYEVAGVEAGKPSNYVRVWCTVAPDGSAIASQLAKGNSSRVLVYEGRGESEPWRTTFDKGGAYALVAQTYRKGSGWGGGYYGDPRGAPAETKTQIGWTDEEVPQPIYEQTLTLYVAQRVTQNVGTGDDRATLVLYVCDNTIVPTLLSIHGEGSPALVDPTSDRAGAAVKVPAVTNAVASLAGLTSSAAAGNLGTIVDDLLDEFRDHASNVNGTWHQNSDNQDDLAINYMGATSLGGVVEALNKLRRRFAQHIANSKENDSSHPEWQLPGAREIHSHNGMKLDLQNTLLQVTADENNPATIYAALGDFWRAYEAHRVALMHEAPDTTNPLATPTGLALVHKEFMSRIAVTAPVTASPGQSLGVTRLVAQAGFEES